MKRFIIILPIMILALCAAAPKRSMAYMPYYEYNNAAAYGQNVTYGSYYQSYQPSYQYQSDYSDYYGNYNNYDYGRNMIFNTYTPPRRASYRSYNYSRRNLQRNYSGDLRSNYWHY
jgi:hypothetical protein